MATPPKPVRPALTQQLACDPWDVGACEVLIDELWALRATMLDNARRLAPWIEGADPAHADSAVNLAHYLALRRHELRGLQERLARMGLSSLGRAETHVLANLDKVLGILHRLSGRTWADRSGDEPTGYRRGPASLARHAQAVFGAPPPQRSVRIMVTLPRAAAHDDGLLVRLVEAGMDVARINCAHDDAPTWAAMAAGVRRAAALFNRPVRVLMDLGGPKLRTGPLAGLVEPVRLKPSKDALGRVTLPARLGLRPRGSAAVVQGAEVCAGVDAEWLAALKAGDRIDLTDASGAARHLTVLQSDDGSVLVECRRTLYLVEGTALGLHRKHGKDLYTTLSDLPLRAGCLHLQRGELLDVVAAGAGAPADAGEPARIACTLPEALAQVRVGARIWFDDGRIGGIVRQATAQRLRVEITQARDGGEKLMADKGINLPDTALTLPALTARDIQDLDAVARCADIVGLSFAQSAADVCQLRQELAARGAAHLGLVLKVETQRGFEHLPEMLMAALAGPGAGVMIARGDLAVECGYERLAEVQEEVLWACEAAHVPVIWATQVLETLAKTGLPSRAEISDAAMAERAECVMLNKGPHIVDAVRMLDNILRRMQHHQTKKRPLLRALKSWTSLPEPPSAERPAAAPSQPREPARRAVHAP